MYNLIMRGNDEPWNPGGSQMELARVLEYTGVWQQREYAAKDMAAFEALRALPVLLGFEKGAENPARIAWLTDLLIDSGDVHFRFRVDESFDPIPTATVFEHRRELGFDHDWEDNRTHWAVKDADLVQWATANGFRRVVAAPEPPRPVERARVFIVHGTNDAAKNELALYLTRVGTLPVILHEQVNAGRTIITKFIETAATADFAVVLMTGDDVGGRDSASLSPRARQNVIFELGFFLSQLPVERVVVLLGPSVERPSDYQGVVYISHQLGWKNELAREMSAAGIAIDFEAAIRS
ncbi:TIR domain-containing protein [Devosia aquimaris]|uniref:TIR domain-containing protein n=1 Tax=Devosia aquimaris TaxID=2866214 RepID=UPI001CD18A97|nr:nucleotide-binding protein [Devosia sp. CJK-A8-3]